MSEISPPPPNFMLLRAWVEATSELPLRVRVRMNAASEGEDVYMNDPKAVGKMVEDWLDGLIVKAAK